MLDPTGLSINLFVAYSSVWYIHYTILFGRPLSCARPALALAAVVIPSAIYLPTETEPIKTPMVIKGRGVSCLDPRGVRILYSGDKSLNHLSYKSDLAKPHPKNGFRTHCVLYAAFVVSGLLMARENIMSVRTQTFVTSLYEYRDTKFIHSTLS